MNFFGSYVQCPFDPSHRIITAKLQKHLFKCRRNYPKDMKVVCPFDATHLLNPEELEHHLSTCTTSGNIKCYQQSLELKREIGSVPIEEACNVETNILQDEDWSGNNPTYNPITISENKNVLRTQVGLSKAQKKQFRHLERERISKIVNKHDDTVDNKSIIRQQPELETPLRIPKNAAKAISLDQTSSNTDNDVNIGDLLSKLKKVDLEKDSTLLEKNVSAINGTSWERSSESSANNISNEKSNSSSHSGQESISKKKINMTRNDVKSYEKSKETAAKNNGTCQYLNKERNKHINSRIASNFGEAKKISTGRGFTIAFQKIQSEFSLEQEERTNVDHYNRLFGYEEDKNDDNDVVSQTK